MVAMRFRTAPWWFMGEWEFSPALEIFSTRTTEAKSAKKALCPHCRGITTAESKSSSKNTYQQWGKLKVRHA
jgi:hypothetical protein